MKKVKVVYVEPADYIPEEIRRECKLGEFAETAESENDPEESTVKQPEETKSNIKKPKQTVKE